MDAAVVHKIHLNHIVARALQNRRGGHADRVVADVPQVLGLVGVRRAELNQDPAAFTLGKHRAGHDSGGHRVPHQGIGLQGDIQKRLRHLAAFHILVGGEKLAGLGGKHHRIGAERLCQREAGDSDIAVKSLGAKLDGELRDIRLEFGGEETAEVVLNLETHKYLKINKL